MGKKDDLIRIFQENWSSVCVTIFAKDVNFKINPPVSVNYSDIEEEISSYQSVISLNYNSDEKDKIFILLNNFLISVVSNLMMGIDTFSEEINDDDKDAFKEAINQMFSSCQVPLKEEVGIDMNFNNIEFTSLLEINDLFNDKEILKWSSTINIEGIQDNNFCFLTSKNFIGSEDKQEDNLIGMQIKESKDSDSNSSLQGNYPSDNLELLMDVELPLTVRIGSTEMKIIDIMRLGLGSLVELEKMVDDPVEILVNDKVVASGEIVVYDGNFAVRINNVASKGSRIKSLG